MRFLRTTSCFLVLEPTFRTVITWDSAAKPVTSDATVATVTNTTDEVLLMSLDLGFASNILKNVEPIAFRIAFASCVAYNLPMLGKNWNVKAILKHWLLIAMVVTGLIGLIYVAVQQDLRQGANDPQIQMAEDAAAKLANGRSVQNVVSSEKVDIANSLAPYLIIFDANGNPIASSAQLDSQTPTISSGVFNYVRQNGEDRFTWQPQTGVRSAVVVTQYKGSNSGFVLAGRSLREVEKREDSLMLVLLAGWVVMILVTFVATAILFRKNST